MKFKVQQIRDNKKWGDLILLSNGNVEIFIDNNMLEIETLSPLQTIAQGETVIHQEEWQLCKISEIPTNDQEISAAMKEII